MDTFFNNNETGSIHSHGNMLFMGYKVGFSLFSTNYKTLKKIFGTISSFAILSILCLVHNTRIINFINEDSFCSIFVGLCIDEPHLDFLE